MDLGSIANVLGLATTAVTATGQAASTAEAIKKLFSSDKKPEIPEAQSLLNTLAGQLTAANMMNVQLSQAIKDLSAELKREDDFEKEKARYELVETHRHDIVFRLKHEQANGQPVHYVCPVCLNRDKVFSFVTGDHDVKNCQTDRTHFFRFDNRPIPGVRTSRGGDW